MRNNTLAVLPAAVAIAFAGCDVARPIEQAQTSQNVNCTACHGTPTENYDFAANPELASPDDTHRPHLVGAQLSNGFDCSSCHVVPTDLSHMDGRIELAFSGLASKDMPGGASYSGPGGTCATYCHGATIAPGGTTPPRSPPWTATTIACDACHGLRPATGLHTAFTAHSSQPCTSCHIGYVSGTTANKAYHVNGVKDVVFLKKNPATAGETYTLTTGWANCANCHDNNLAHP